MVKSGLGLGCAVLIGLLALGGGRSLASELDGGWRLQCSEQSDCRISRVLLEDEQKAPAFMLTITGAPRSSLRFGVITTPINVFMPPGVLIEIDGGRPFKALFERCDTVGCHAGFRMPAPMIHALRKGHIARIKVAKGSKQAVEIPLSLKGFSAAFDTLTTGGRK